MDKNQKNESGVAALLLAVVIMLVLLAMVATAAAFTSSIQLPRIQYEQKQYVQSVVKRIGAYYQSNAWALSQGKTFPLTASELLTDVGVNQKYGLQLCIGDQQQLGQYRLPYYNIWAWVPHPGGGKAPVCGSNTFTPNSVQNFALYSGAVAQQNLLLASAKSMRDLGAALVTGFEAAQQSGGVHNIDVDYFKPYGCDGDNGAGPLACAESWTDASQMSLDSWIGSSGLYRRNAWGQELQIENTAPVANDQEPPYTIFVRSLLPGGAYLEQEFSEPIG
ncbi:hypothetical protein B1757_13270 [Acidithiobacillus marinus]|uniref:Uncharacterized protein n=1 Tax=Acidithiobacillus marinus TaxID=187490 RepID=A0A2I1DIS9_9PROT|nr:hypothetical protein [Acidithiobacillus marinus]PKY09765.1 hypothetical protein B1757_13270 [Acidithiobacillus marinus]